MESGKVTFFRALKTTVDERRNLGNFLNVVSIAPDCDNDTLLVLANPIGPACAKAPAAASATPLTSGCSCINWNNCSPTVLADPEPSCTPPNRMPAAPNALRRKWARKAWKPHCSNGT
ncbi:phosphoribosyl-AMP cyclohydrolase [Shigella sonnei]